MIGWAHEVTTLPKFLASRAMPPPAEIPPDRGGRSTAAAAANDAAVLDVLRDGRLRNGEIAEATGLSRATISGVLQRLAAAGKVKPTDETRSAPWRVVESE